MDTDALRRRGRACRRPTGFASGSYDLVLSALVPYKRIDLAVAAADRGRPHPGGGRQAGPSAAACERPRPPRPAARAACTSPGAVADADLPRWYGHCRSFVFPGLEDFGITPLEATAAGRPVVAYRAGGALDTVREGLNGVFFAEQTVRPWRRPWPIRAWTAPGTRQAMLGPRPPFGRDRLPPRTGQALAAAWRAHTAADPRRQRSAAS